MFDVGDLVWLHLRKDRFPDLRKSKLMPLMGSLHGKQKISTVNMAKTKIQSRRKQDLIYQDLCYEMISRLTLEDPKAYKIRLVVDVVDRFDDAIRQHFRTRSCVRCR